ncbi:hypothetical protein, partial [Klebsiella pneumoniae]|uniref:hypothetical protein n=1 Tax=Klebsiella pneumoniae TaxID=573 RepID=UPI0024DE5856
ALEKYLYPRQSEIQLEKDDYGDPHLSFDQVSALGHGLEPFDVFQHRYDARQLPDQGHVHESHGVQDHDGN